MGLLVIEYISQSGDLVVKSGIILTYYQELRPDCSMKRLPLGTWEILNTPMRSSTATVVLFEKIILIAGAPSTDSSQSIIFQQCNNVLELNSSIQFLWTLSGTSLLDFRIALSNVRPPIFGSFFFWTRLRFLDFQLYLIKFQFICETWSRLSLFDWKRW